MSPQLNNLIDNAMAWRESLVSRLMDAQAHGHDTKALTLEQALRELDVLLVVVTRGSTIN